MSHKVKKNHTQAYVNRTLRTLPTRDWVQTVHISLEALHDNETREDAFSFFLPAIGEVFNGYQITGRIGRDLIVIDGSRPIYDELGMLIVQVRRTYTVEKVD
jgi:hypothetical protein